MIAADALITLAAKNPLDHVLPHPTVVGENGFWYWSNITTNLIISGIIVVAGMMLAAKHIATGDRATGATAFLPTNRFAHTIEVVLVYIREQVVRPLLGDRTEGFMPLLWTLFFFILTTNLLGLVPLLDINLLLNPGSHYAWVGGTATQHIWVTGVLALISFIVINIAGLRQLGVGGYCHHLTGGAPVFVWPILVPVEILGTFVKPFALAVRLFANMTAGHTLVATLFGFVGMSLAGLGLLIGSPVAAIAIVAAVAIYFLEIFVGFLQAFVFMFLTTVFISQLQHHDHDHEHGHEHETHDGPQGATLAGAA